MNLSLKEFFETKQEELSLSLVTNPETLNNEITGRHINRPSLALTGFFERFSYKRIQILGETEIGYMQSLSDELLYDRLKEMLIYDIPCLIITKGLSAPNLPPSPSKSRPYRSCPPMTRPCLLCHRCTPGGQPP